MRRKTIAIQEHSAPALARLVLSPLIFEWNSFDIFRII
jgi:hypothetical protein